MGKTRETAERMLTAMAQAKHAAQVGNDDAWLFYFNQAIDAALAIKARFPEGIPMGYAVLERHEQFVLYSQFTQDYVFETYDPEQILIRASLESIVAAARLIETMRLSSQVHSEIQMRQHEGGRDHV